MWPFKYVRSLGHGKHAFFKFACESTCLYYSLQRDEADTAAKNSL